MHVVKNTFFRYALLQLIESQTVCTITDKLQLMLESECCASYQIHVPTGLKNFQHDIVPDNSGWKFNHSYSSMEYPSLVWV